MKGKWASQAGGLRKEQWGSLYQDSEKGQRGTLKGPLNEQTGQRLPKDAAGLGRGRINVLVIRDGLR